MNFANKEKNLTGLNIKFFCLEMNAHYDKCPDMFF